MAVGLLIAYRAFSDYRMMDAQDVAIMFVFAFALLSLLGLRIFIIDRQGQHVEVKEEERANRDAEGVGPWTT